MVEGTASKAIPANEEDLRTLLNPVRRRRSGRLGRSLYLAFTRLDEAAFTRLLLKSFPEMLFADLPPRGTEPLVRPLTGLSADRTAHSIRAFVPPPGWDWSAVHRARNGFVSGLPERSIAYWPGINMQPTDASGRPERPNLSPHTVLTGYYYRDDREQQAFVRQVWRLVDRITEREVKEIYRNGEAKGRVRSHMTRLGYDALRWCAQHPERRLLNDYRPIDGWAMPESPWYD